MDEWDQLLAYVEASTPRPGPNMLGRQTPAGVLLSGATGGGRGGGTGRHPWQLIRTTTGGENPEPALRLEPATFGGVWPTIAEHPLNDVPPPLLVPSSDGVQDVLLRVEIEPTSMDVSEEGDGTAWVADGGELESVTVVLGDDDEEPQEAEINSSTGAVVRNGVWLVPIGTVERATDDDVTTLRVTAQALRHSLWWKVCGRETTLELLLGQA